MTSSKVGVGVLLPLLLSLLLLADSKSYASEVASTAPNSQTSDNLIDNDNWNGATYGADPGGCCSSISGSGALYDTTTDTILFSYGQDILSQTIAINQALQQSGIQVDGYNYGWTWRRISNSGNGGDTLRFEVTVKDANGNEVEDYTYDYSNVGIDDQWYVESGHELWSPGYTDPQNIQLRIIGKDGGFWAGYYGPEVKDVSLTLNYSSNPCAADPLFDPSCDGYADAYAEQQYNQNCSADPLYDSGCPGYQQAYYNQQCNVNPLYDQGCPGYAQAYYDQQCSIDPLYDAACPGYAAAYYDQQCSLDALYDTGCPGYAQAYLDQQCELDQLYDRTCPGYSEAYAKKNILNEETTSTETTVSTTSTETVPITDPEEIAMPSTTGDSTVDSILKDLTDVPTQTFTVETGPVASVETETETQETSQEVETSTETDTAREMEELVANVETEETDETPSDELGGGDTDGEDSEDQERSGSESEDDKKETKREKLKKAVAAKAANLANDMSEAATLEAQQAVQAQVLALINYVPDFNTYNRMMNGGYLPDAAGYSDTQLPETKRGLRNGLAQQLLHEQMVQEQYNR